MLFPFLYENMKQKSKIWSKVSINIIFLFNLNKAKIKNIHIQLENTYIL